MIYQSLGHNDTGQQLLACPHIPRYVTLNLFEMPDGAASYESRGLPFTHHFLPSKKTIVIWCQECYRAFGKDATGSESRLRQPH